MANLTISKVSIVESVEQFDAPAGETFAVGSALRIDDTTGYATKANSTTSAEAQHEGIATLAASFANETVTILKEGVVDVGEALAGMAFGAPVYLSDTDGTYADSAGTVSTIVGHVVPGFGNASAADRLLRIIRRSGA